MTQFLLDINGKIMVSYKQLRQDKVRRYYIELKRLDEEVQNNGIMLFNWLPTDLQKEVHKYLKPKEREKAPVYVYEEVDLT